MKIHEDNQTWMIKKGPSPFVSRTGKKDCRIMLQGEYGSREEDNKKYRTSLWIACESGEILRSYETIPNSISLEFLKDNAFID